LVLTSSRARRRRDFRLCRSRSLDCSFLINYFSQSEIGNLSAVVAAGYVAFYWGARWIGRFMDRHCCMAEDSSHGPLFAIAGVLLMRPTVEWILVFRLFSRIVTALVGAVEGRLFRSMFRGFGFVGIELAFTGGRVAMKTGHLLDSRAFARQLSFASRCSPRAFAMWSIIRRLLYSIMFPVSYAGHR